MPDGDLSRYAHASGVAFIACLLVTLVAGEVFYWAVDVPATLSAKWFFAWLRE